MRNNRRTTRCGADVGVDRGPRTAARPLAPGRRVGRGAGEASGADRAGISLAGHGVRGAVMNPGQLREIRLRDFRCFGEPQTAPLSPLTLLVGENSTGKTSFLVAVSAICDIASRQQEPDFREPPYDLGSFPEIVHGRGGKSEESETFEIGIKALGSESQMLECRATFKSGYATPRSDFELRRVPCSRVTTSRIPAARCTRPPRTTK